MRASWRRHIAIGSAATLLVLGACGDDDDDDAAADEPATEAGAPEDEVAAFCDAIDGMGLGVSIGEGYEGMDEALEAAEEVATYERDLAEIKSDGRLLKWITGTTLAGVLALVLRVFTS